ncbi:MAG: hypothetical protein ACRD2T_00185 [Thermoanaerobaculia bacterium]
MSCTTKAEPVTAPAKPAGGPKKRLPAWGRVLTSLKRPLSALRNSLPPLKQRLSALRKALPPLRGVLPALKRRCLALRGALPILARLARTHLSFLGRLPAWSFVPAAGLWTVLFKTALVPVAALLTALIFRPLGIASLFETSPILKLSDALTRGLYEASFLGLGWASASTLSLLALAGVILPVACTLLAQLVPLETLARRLPSQRWRISLSLAVVGILYLLSWGEVALLLTGAAIGVPLTWIFLHWRRRASALRACLVTGGVHALANAAVILSRGLLGGV